MKCAVSIEYIENEQSQFAKPKKTRDILFEKEKIIDFKNESSLDFKLNDKKGFFDFYIDLNGAKYNEKGSICFHKLEVDKIQISEKPEHYKFKIGEKIEIESFIKLYKKIVFGDIDDKNQIKKTRTKRYLSPNKSIKSKEPNWFSRIIRKIKENHKKKHKFKFKFKNKIEIGKSLTIDPQNNENENINDKQIEKSQTIDPENNYIKNINEDDITLKKSESSKLFRVFRHKKIPSCTLPENITEKLYEEKKENNIEPIIKLPESFPYSENYENYKSKFENNKKLTDNRECFCEGFFIASFPQKEGKVIENSQTFPSPCGDPECSSLPAMAPEIIMRYPLEDTKTLELNNLAATICFPTGIKVCYSNLNEPANIKDYLTSITNQKGERYYMMTYHFYYKIPNHEYIKLYEINSLKYFSQKYLDAASYLSEEEYDNKKDEIQEKVDKSEELISMENVYVPFCICLISKYPYVEEMKKCLQTIYDLLRNNPTGKKEDINNLIMYLIHSVPIPKKSSLVKFYIPYYNEGITLSCPKVKDINVMNTNISDLFQYFSIDNILLIFRLILNEKKILFFDDDYTRLSNVSDSFLTLLYPFQWTHTYIPIMSDQMLKYLQTFLPFINGINSSLIDLVKDVFKEIQEMESDEVFIININKNKNICKDIITCSSNLINKKINFEKYIQDNVPSLPFQLERDLRRKLKQLEYEINKLNNKIKDNTFDQKKRDLDLKVRNAFLDMFIEMFHYYYNYTVNISDDDNVFNQSLFINNFEEKDKRFFNEFFETQLFQLFIQNCRKDELSYFNSMITQFNIKKSMPNRDSNDITSKDNNNYFNNTFNISKLYLIKPEYLNINENNGEEISNQLKKLYQCDTKKDEKDENEPKILESFEQIEDQNYNDSNCKIYILPEEKPVKKIVKIKKSDEDDSIIKNSLYDRIKKLDSEVIKKDNRYKEKFDDKEKDNINDTINEFCRKIFEGSQVEEDQIQKKELQNAINNFQGRQYFIDLLSKQNPNNIVLLSEKSFNLLGNLIYNSLLFILKIPETNKIIEHMASLIKTTRLFGKELKEKGKNKIITIFEEYKYKFQGYSKVNQMNFWQKWYDIEIHKENNVTDDIKEQVILKICEIMFELELNKSFIKNTLQKIGEKVFGKESEKFNDLIGKVIDKIKKAQYIGSFSKNNPKIKK